MANIIPTEILIIDDCKTVLRIISDQLKQLGYSHIDDAADGNEALQKLNNKNYDLIISDWYMNPMSGFDLLQAVRAVREFESTPFIMITSDASIRNEIAAKRAGVSGFLTKPFDAKSLKTKIDEAFENHLLYVA